LAGCAIIIFVTRETTSASPGPSIRLTLAVTGASGSIFAAEMLRALNADVRVAKVDFIPSEAALRVFAEEMKLSGRSGLVEKLLGRSGLESKIVQHTEADIGANVASGSYRSDGMIVLPCTMGTLAGIANGMASNLIERAADVCLKEGRRLILCVRETPFNRIHLRNMQLASDAGATIFPVMPTLYNLPRDTTQMARQFVDRVLAHIGLPQPGAFEWKAD
jgi:4-hydroxy-3-polyprenylbenzoate decarboxylase